MKYTKGPLKVTKQDGEIFITDNHCVNLCAMVEGSYTPETIEANAHIMAAAPELLEALKDLLAWTKITAMYHLKDKDLLPKGL